jgi:hypothetical protein
MGTRFKSTKFHYKRNYKTNSEEYQLLRGLRDGTTHPRRRPRTNDAYPILIRTEMSRIHRVAVLSDTRFAPIDPLRREVWVDRWAEREVKPKVL